MTRAEYLKRVDRRRIASSLGFALGLYFLAGVFVFVSGLLHLSDLGNVPSTVWVDIGSASDLVKGRSGGGDVPAPKSPEAPVPAPVVAKPPTASVPKTATPPSTSTAAAKTASVGSSSAPDSAKSLPAQGATDQGGEPWIPGPRPAGSRVISTTSGSGTSGAGESSPASPFVTKVVGNEKGNSLETVLGVGAGKSGRTLYVPIYLYMPLPKIVTDNVAVRVSPSRRDLFMRTYKRINEQWVLSREVPVQDRDEIWLALEEGGYDVAKADYKEGGALKPVTLSFVVTPASPTSQPSLAAVSVTSSSGDPAVDEAVMYGFKRASFFNATDGAISGTFTYRFQR